MLHQILKNLVLMAFLIDLSHLRKSILNQVVATGRCVKCELVKIFVTLGYEELQ